MVWLSMILFFSECYPLMWCLWFHSDTLILFVPLAFFGLLCGVISNLGVLVLGRLACLHIWRHNNRYLCRSPAAHQSHTYKCCNQQWSTTAQNSERTHGTTIHYERLLAYQIHSSYYFLVTLVGEVERPYYCYWWDIQLILLPLPYFDRFIHKKSKRKPKKNAKWFKSCNYIR